MNKLYHKYFMKSYLIITFILIIIVLASKSKDEPKKNLGRDFIKFDLITKQNQIKINLTKRDDGCISGDTNLLMCNGSIKKALDIKTGDCVSGSTVYYTKHYYGSFAVVEHNETYLTPEHLILINNNYVRAGEINNQKYAISKCVVYILTYNNHIITENNITLSNHNNNHWLGNIKTLHLRLYYWLMH